MYGIDKRVWSKVVGKKPITPELVALAASLCPEILSERLRTKPYGYLSWTENSPLATQCGTSVVQIRNALAAWVMDQEDAIKAIAPLAEWDSKLGMWCACAVVETALKYIPPGEPRPQRAIKTARAWVVGRATGKEGIESGRASQSAASLYYGEAAKWDEDRPAWVRAGRVAEAARMATIPGRASAAKAVEYAAMALVGSTPSNEGGVTVWVEGIDDENVRLREVVAQGVFSYPTLRTRPPSGSVELHNALVAGVVGAAVGALTIHFARRS